MDKTMEDYASECRRIAEMTDDPIIRDEMMKMARRWMEAALGSKKNNSSSKPEQRDVELWTA